MLKAFAAALFLTTAAQAQTTYYYDQYGRPEGSSDTLGNSFGNSGTTYYYDQYGRLQGSSFPLGGTTYYYDQYGRPQGNSFSLDRNR